MKIFARTLLAAALALAGTLAHADAFAPKGEVSWQYTDAQGHPIAGQTGKTHNLVVDSGKAYFASRAINASAAVMGWLAVGTGSTAEAASQTALVTETARVAFASMTASGNVITITATVPAGTATGTLQEIGLFNAASAGTMVSRALTGALSKPAGMGLTFTWTLTIG